MSAYTGSLAAAGLNLALSAFYLYRVWKLGRDRNEIVLERLGISHLMRRVICAYERLAPQSVDNLLASLCQGEAPVVDEAIDRLAWLRDQHMTGDRLTDETDEMLFKIARQHAAGDVE